MILSVLSLYYIVHKCRDFNLTNINVDLRNINYNDSYKDEGVNHAKNSQIRRSGVDKARVARQ